MSELSELKYTPEHEWIRIDGDVLTIGITAFAAEKLGEVVYVDLPEVGQSVQRGKVVSEVESTKSVGEVYAPVDGEIVEVNAAVSDNPELINDSPFDQGWLFSIRVSSDALAQASFIDLDAYSAITGA